MKKGFVFWGIFAISLYLLMQPAVYYTLLSFLFIGLVPGTQITLPFWVMWIIFCIIAGVALAWLFNQTLYIGDHAYTEKIAKAKAREHVLKTTAKTKTNRIKRKKPLAKQAALQSKKRLRRHLSVAN